MRFVLDSSFIAKLFFRETGSEKALEIMEIALEKDISFMASELVFYEVGNVIWKRLRGTANDGKEYLQQLRRLDIDFVGLGGDLMTGAMEEAQRSEITYYDAVHVRLARREGVRLITEDAVLLEKFGHAVSIEDALGSME